MENMSAPEILISDKKSKKTTDPDSLTADLTELIAAKASSIEDFVRFGAVRRSWRLATLSVGPRLDYQSLSPWMMIGDRSPDRSWPWKMIGDQSPDQLRRRFHSAATGELSRIESPEAIKMIIRRSWGSPFGWIIVPLNRTLIQPITLFNPISRASISLPSPKIPPFTRYGENPFRRRHGGQVACLVRAVLTASPDSPECVLFSITLEHRELHYVRPGDSDSRRGSGEGWSDIIGFKGDLYGCLCDGKVLNLSVSPSGMSTTEFAPAPCDLDTSSVLKDPTALNVKYLVDLGGELCMVIRLARKMNSDLADSISVVTFGFEMYKLDIYSKVWEILLSLDDKCIFVGANYSYSVRASSSHLKADCIYFSDDFCAFKGVKTGGKCPGFNDMGIYDVANDQVAPITTLLSESNEHLDYPNFPPIWFTPTLQ